MRENQIITGYWYSPGTPCCSGFFVGGAGIFQIYDTKSEAVWRTPIINEAVVKWRIDSIRNGKATYPCPVYKDF